MKKHNAALASLVGTHRAVFRIDKISKKPWRTDSASSSPGANFHSFFVGVYGRTKSYFDHHRGQMWEIASLNVYCKQGVAASWLLPMLGPARSDAERYDVGDMIAVMLDLDAGSITYAKNGRKVLAQRHAVQSDEAYNFIFAASYEGDAVTLVDVK